MIEVKPNHLEWLHDELGRPETPDDTLNVQWLCDAFNAREAR